MAVAHTTVLDLLGKQISFTLKLPEELRFHVSDSFANSTGLVKGVLVALDGNHEILIDDEFYLLSDITLN